MSADIGSGSEVVGSGYEVVETHHDPCLLLEGEANYTAQKNHQNNACSSFKQGNNSGSPR